MKTHGGSFPSRVKDSSVAAGILENVSGFGEEIFVGRVAWGEVESVTGIGLVSTVVCR